MLSAAKIDWSFIRQLASASATAYDWATISDPRTDTQVFIQADPDRIVVAFRGSSSIRDFVLDADFGMEELLWANDSNPASVHQGFLDAFESVDSDLVQKVKYFIGFYPGAEIYLTGHSLGGALAVLCAMKFYRIKLPLAGVVTFGQPRVGNRAFAQAYNAVLKDCTLALVNSGDPVPLLPPLLNGYRDCGTEIFLGDTVQVDPFIGLEIVTDVLGALASWRTGRLGLIPHHFIANYQRRIQFL